MTRNLCGWRNNKEVVRLTRRKSPVSMYHKGEDPYGKVVDQRIELRVKEVQWRRVTSKETGRFGDTVGGGLYEEKIGTDQKKKRYNE